MPVRPLRNTRTRNRRAFDPAHPFVPASAIITGMEMTADDTVRLTFNERVLPTGVPGFTAGAAGEQTVETMARISDTVIELTFTGAVDESKMLVPEGDAGLRTASGGFVPAGSYDLPEFQQAA